MDDLERGRREAYDALVERRSELWGMFNLLAPTDTAWRTLSNQLQRVEDAAIYWGQLRERRPQ